MDWQKYIKYGPNYKNMKEEKRDYCIRLLNKLLDNMFAFTAMKDEIKWIEGLIVEVRTMNKDYILPRDIRIKCNDLWKETLMRKNY